MSQLGFSGSLAASGLVALLLAACGSKDKTEGLVGTGLVINEACAKNNGFWHILDDFGESDDWVELYNGEEQEARLGGFFLSDKSDDRMKSQLSNELVIAPKDVLLLWADGQPEQGATHMDFKLSNSDGQGVFLSDESGGLLDHITLHWMVEEDSFARIPNGTGPVRLCELPTPGENNVCWEGALDRDAGADGAAGGSGSDDEGGRP